MTGEDFLFELSGWGGCGGCGGGEGQIPAINPFGAVLMVLALGGGSAYVLRRRH